MARRLFGQVRNVDEAGLDVAAAGQRVRHAPSAAALMCEQPSVIKRPVVEWQGGPAGDVAVGFSPEAWNARAASHSKA